MSAVAANLVEHGVGVNDVKPTISKMCQPKNWQLPDRSSEAAQVLDLKKLKDVKRSLILAKARNRGN